MTVQIDVELNEKWRDDIGELYSEFKAMDGAEVDLHADVDSASRDIEALRGEVETLTSGDHELEVETDIDHDSLQRSINSLDDLEVDDVNLDLGDLDDVGDIGDVNVGVEMDDDAKDVIDHLQEISDGDGHEFKSYRVDTSRDVTYRENVEERYEPEDKEGSIFYDEKLRNRIFPSDKEGTIWYDERLKSGGLDTADKKTEGEIDFKIDREGFGNDLGRLLGDMDAVDTELEIEVCIKKCDDWDQTLNSIGADFDAIKDWEENEGNVDVRLRGAVDELTDAVDQIEDSDEVNTVQRMVDKADSDDDVMKQVMRDAGMTPESDKEGGASASRSSGPGWQRDDRKWIGGNPAIVTDDEKGRQTDRLDRLLGDLGLSGDTSGDRFRAGDIDVTKEMEDAVIRDIYGDDVADSPAANFHRDEAKKVARKRAFSDVVREHSKPAASTYSGRDYSDHGEFDVMDTSRDTFYRSRHSQMRSDPLTPDGDEDREEVHGQARMSWQHAKETEGEYYYEGSGKSPEGIGNIADKEHGTNPFTEKEQSFLNRLGISTPETQFFDSDDSSGTSNWFKSVSRRRTGSGGFGQFRANSKRWKRGGGASNWGKILGLGGLPGFGGDGKGGGSGGPGIKSIKKLMPTMAKYWQLIATLSPMLITLAANAVGVAAAFGSIAAAGGAVVGLGLLGFGDNVNESMKIAKRKISTFKSELAGVFRSTFQQFSPFTEAFLTTAPTRMRPLAESMGGLTEFMPTFNAGFNGLIDFVSEFIDVMVSLQPIISQLGMRFGAIFGDLLIDAFRWFIQTAYKSQDVMIAVGGVIMDVLSLLYMFAQVLTFLTAIFSPFISMIAWVASFISTRWVAALLAGAGAIYAVATAVGFLSGAFSTLLATSLSSMAASIASFAATAITSFLAAAEALAVLIAGEATLLGMTGAGLALVATGIAAGYAAYSAIAPKGASGLGAGGAGGAPGVGGGGGMGSSPSAMGGTAGGGKTIINVEGDLDKETIDDVEDAIQSEQRIYDDRNDV